MTKAGSPAILTASFALSSSVEDIQYPKSFVLVAMYAAAPVNCEGNLPAMFAKETCKVG
jgi:hypothetical protein